MNVVEAIEKRRSVRGYTEKPVTQEQIEILKKAAMESPTARNLQPLHFSFLTNKEIMGAIDATYRDALRALPNMQLRTSVDETYLAYEAPLFIVISSNRAAEFGVVDAGIAVQTLALAAEGIGLSSVIIGMLRLVFKMPKGPEIRKMLQIPNTHEFVIAIAIGEGNMTKEAHDMRPENISVIE